MVDLPFPLPTMPTAIPFAPGSSPSRQAPTPLGNLPTPPIYPPAPATISAAPALSAPISAFGSALASAYRASTPTGPAALVGGPLGDVAASVPQSTFANQPVRSVLAPPAASAPATPAPDPASNPTPRVNPYAAAGSPEGWAGAGPIDVIGGHIRGGPQMLSPVQATGYAALLHAQAAANSPQIQVQRQIMGALHDRYMNLQVRAEQQGKTPQEVATLKESAYQDWLAHMQQLIYGNLFQTAIGQSFAAQQGIGGYPGITP